MAIEMDEYVSNQTTVYAGVIDKENLGDVVQELFDNGANHISINTYPTNPLDSTDTDVHTNIIVAIRGGMYSIVFGDYLVEEETETETILTPMKKDVFENRFSVVI